MNIKHPIYDDCAWGGFRAFALDWAETHLKTAITLEERYQSAWLLCRLASSNGDFDQAIKYAEITKDLFPFPPDGISVHMYHAWLLQLVGKTEEAWSAATKTREVYGGDRRLDFLCSYLARDTNERLEWINKSLDGFSPVRLRDPSKPLTLTNLTAEAASVDGPKVSVIMPCFNASETIETAVRGVLEQSWGNLELIIVDDASTDDSWAKITDLAQLDPRIIPIRQPVNGGAYRARNTGLARATGKYVTINDSDDWSHPQRIEVQIKDMLDRPSKRTFSTTTGVRCDDSLAPMPKPRSGGFFIENTSSLIAARDDMQRLGGWDEVRFSADSELYSRLMLLKKRGPRHSCPRVPFSFILSRPDSLTNTTSATGLGSLFYGARRTYKDISQQWHARGGRYLNGKGREFPAPQIALTGSSASITLDSLIIADFTSADDPLNLAVGDHVGILHIPTPMTLRAPLRDRVLDALLDRKVQAVVSGEKVSCGTVKVWGGIPFLPDTYPEIKCTKCLLFHVPPLDEERTIANVKRITGMVPVIVTKSPSFDRAAHISHRLAPLEAEIRRLEAKLNARMKARAG